MADKKSFSLSDVIRGSVGEASTAAMGAAPAPAEGREQIVYLPRTALVADERNFYSMDGIEDLARNIELVGILDPLRVRPIEGEQGLYRVVSGHRRRAAVDWLALHGKDLGELPCILEPAGASDALTELRLIYANSDTRRMSDADLAKQAERVQALLYELKEAGYEFPGRMRDYVAEACKVSKTKLSTLKVIREKLPEAYRADFEGGKMSTDAAYRIASAPAELQERIVRAYPKKPPDAAQVRALAELRGAKWGEGLKCPDGTPCGHGDAFLRHDATCDEWSRCEGKTCCLDCEFSTRDFSPCSSACARAKKLRDEKAAQKREDRAKSLAAENRAKWKKISKSARRLLLAVEAAMLEDKERLPASLLGKRLTVADLREIAGGSQTWTEKQPPYWDPLKFELGQQERQWLDLLGCTSDFLLGLTDDPAPRADRAEEPEPPAPAWRTGTPPKDGHYWTMEDNGELTDLYLKAGTWYPWRHECRPYFDGDYGEIVKWYPLPEDEA